MDVKLTFDSFSKKLMQRIHRCHIGGSIGWTRVAGKAAFRADDGGGPTSRHLQSRARVPPSRGSRAYLKMLAE